VAKFYRPGRGRESLQDEHDFLQGLVESEIPVIAPCPGDGGTLGSHEGMNFAVFPKKSGRVFDEYSDEQWLELGRLLGRVHTVGAGFHPKDRITMSPDKSTRNQVDYILTGNFVPTELSGQFRDLTGTLIDEISRCSAAST